MNFKFLAFAGVAGLMMFAPASAAAQATHKHDAAKPMACCEGKTMPCCEAKDTDIIGQLVSQQPPSPPAKQLNEVWFMRPVMVGRKILQGHYVIEHDNDRMAAGGPCTYIYAFNDRTKPVVAFYCEHLEREPATRNIVVLERRGDIEEMKEFQFRGETASHGVPIVR